MTAAAVQLAPPDACFHCGLEVPVGTDYGAEVAGAWRPMCCPGCAAVAETIVAQGFDAYYTQRDGPARRADEASPCLPPEIFDDPELQRDFVRASGDGATATFSLEGVRCAACAWLIERQLRRLRGVATADVSLADHRALVTYDPGAIRPSDLMRAVADVGYVAHPYEPDRERELHTREQRAALLRLGISGLGAMQVMMYAVALYAGALEGMTAPYRELLRWVSLLVATFVVTIGARPFFEGALRDLRARQLGMDVPVALAIGLAYLASAGATFSGTGEVYFDSVCMFTFLLSLGRFLEQRVRHGSDERVRSLSRRVPATARIVDATGERIVPARSLQRGDVVAVRRGESIPLDGRVVEGASAVSEALWTGEDAPQHKREGDAVIGGSQNLEAPLRVRVEATGAEGTLATIRGMLDRARAEKPPIARTADRWSRAFVGVVLVVAAATAFGWWLHSPADALWVTLSVLVATCPCALSLATPTALAAATDALANAGFLVTRGHVLEGLAEARAFAFDKTGTLTGRELEVEDVVTGDAAPWDRDLVLAAAALLESESPHPVATAFEHMRRPDAGLVQEREAETGLGVGGRIAGRRLRLGHPDWVREIFTQPAVVAPPADRAGSWILLGGECGPMAWIGLRARLRDGAAEVVSALQARGIWSVILSGDPSSVELERVASAVGADGALGGVSPEAKVEALASMQEEAGCSDGGVVVAVGDGINDAPLLGRAQVSIAMASGSDLARVSADAVLIEDRLPLLARAVDRARATRRVVRQNLVWAALYNAAVLPLAVSGQLPPWAAAIGMSASSLAVVLNAARLRRPLPGGAG